MKNNDAKTKALIFVCAVIPLIYLILLSATMILCSRSVTSIPDISKNEPEIEYFNINTTGGFTWHDTDLTAYTENGRYYLEYKDNRSEKDAPEKYELTKTEFLLCTDIDFEALRDEPGLLGNDMSEYALTVRKKGGETQTIDSKIYKSPTFGQMFFILDMKREAPNGNISYGRYIDLASYLYSCGIDSASMNYDTKNTENPESRRKVYTLCVNKKQMKTLAALKTLRNNAVQLFREPKSEKAAQHRDEFIAECEKIAYFKGTAYYREIISEEEGSISLVIASTEYSDMITFLSEIPENVPMEQYLRDIRSILTGNSEGLTIVRAAISAETALFVTVMFFAAEKARKKLTEEHEDPAYSNPRK